MQAFDPAWKNADPVRKSTARRIDLPGPASHESQEVRDMRDALGAVAVAEPAIIVLRAEAGGEWHLRRVGQSEELRFPDRERALSAARLAVVRCTAYWLRVENDHGEVHDEFLNWPPIAMRSVG
jgi:hypothetical protein